MSNLLGSQKHLEYLIDQLNNNQSLLLSDEERILLLLAKELVTFNSINSINTSTDYSRIDYKKLINNFIAFKNKLTNRYSEILYSDAYKKCTYNDYKSIYNVLVSFLTSKIIPISIKNTNTRPTEPKFTHFLNDSSATNSPSQPLGSHSSTDQTENSTTPNDRQTGPGRTEPKSSTTPTDPIPSSSRLEATETKTFHPDSILSPSRLEATETKTLHPDPMPSPSRLEATETKILHTDPIPSPSRPGATETSTQKKTVSPLIDSEIPDDKAAIDLTLEYRGKSLNSDIADKMLKNIVDDFDTIHFSHKNDINFTLKINNNMFLLVNCVANNFMSENLGLDVKNINHQIFLSNKPKEGYDDKLYFRIFIKNLTNGRPKVYHKEMYIAPDPRSLWQNLEVEDYDGYPMPHEAFDAKKIPETAKIVLAASCRGRSHAHSAKPRDDSYAMNLDAKSGWNIVAVADGAGSAKYSRKGSKIACETVVNDLIGFLNDSNVTAFINQKDEFLLDWREKFNKNLSSPDFLSDNDYIKKLHLDDIFYKIVYKAFENIYTESQNKKAVIRDYHTTLLFIAFKKLPCGYFFGSFWIGDGAMAIYKINNTDKVLVLGVPDSGEYAGQTRFLTMREEIKLELVKKRTRFGIIDDFEAIILATDGITDPFFPSEESVATEANWINFWDNTLKKGDSENLGCEKVFDSTSTPEEKAQDLRKWLDFWSKGNHDDRTILIVK
jgi:serine/threonine protein phosphatase PrpC